MCEFILWGGSTVFTRVYKGPTLLMLRRSCPSLPPRMRSPDMTQGQNTVSENMWLGLCARAKLSVTVNITDNPRLGHCVSWVMSLLFYTSVGIISLDWCMWGDWDRVASISKGADHQACLGQSGLELEAQEPGKWAGWVDVHDASLLQQQQHSCSPPELHAHLVLLVRSCFPAPCSCNVTSPFTYSGQKYLASK